MKLFLSIALVLLVTVSFGDCNVTSPKGEKSSKSPKAEKSPKSPKSEKSPKLEKNDSHKQLTDAMGALNVAGASHDQSSPAFQFASALNDIISKNYKIYTQIKEYFDRFTEHAGDWSPIELIIIKMKMIFDISDSEELTTLKTQFNTYKPKLVELMGKIKPVHEQNQKLAELVNGFINSETKLADLTTEPQIDSKLTEELHKEAEKVTKVYEEFEKLMEHFQMKLFIEKLDEVRAAIVKLRNQQLFLDQAEKIFAETVEGSKELVAPNVETLDAALKIHYADLTKVNEKLQGIVKKVMHAHEPAKHAKK